MNSFALLQPCTSVPCRAPETGQPWVSDVYTLLLDAIVEQRIAPGSRLTEEGLGQMFGASRSHVREALSLLCYQQMITMQPNARTSVAAPTDEQIRQALHARRWTEMALIPMACQQPQKDDVHQFRRLLEKQRQARAENRQAAAIRWSGAFHLHLAEMAGNAPLAHFLGNLVPLTSLAIAGHDLTSTATCQQQEAIAKAVEDQDATTAARLMGLYLDNMVPGCTPAQVKPSAEQTPHGSWPQANRQQ